MQKVREKGPKEAGVSTGIPSVCVGVMGTGFLYGNVQISYDAWGGGLLKPSEYHHMRGGGIWSNRHITFIVAKKAYHMWGLVENVMGRRLAENVRIPSYRGKGSKIAQKTVI